jgi:hypothetical protein
MLKLIFVLTLIFSFQALAFAQYKAVEGFYIEAEINGKKVSYAQKNADWLAPSNHYYPKYAVTHLQAYEKDDSQIFHITVFDLKLDKTKVPHKINLKNDFSLSTGISGYDTKGGNCGGIDNGCVFAGSSKNGAMRATITKVDYKNKIIEGTFSGKLILTRTGIVRGNYPNTFLTVKNGRFKMNFRLADG